MTNTASTATAKTATSHYPDPAIVLPLLLGLLRSPPSSGGGGADEYGANNNNSGNTVVMTTTSGVMENEYNNNSNDAVAEEEEEDDLIPPQASMMSSSNNSNLYAKTRDMNFPQRLHRLLSRGKLRNAATTSPKVTTKTRSSILSWSDHGRSFIAQGNATTQQLPVRYLFDDEDVTMDNNTDGDMIEAAATCTLDNDLMKFENELIFKWGFRLKKQTEEEKGMTESEVRYEYYHPLFLRGQFHLLSELTPKEPSIKSNDNSYNNKRTKTKKGSNSETATTATTKKKGTRKADTSSSPHDGGRMDDIEEEEEEGDDAIDTDADSTAATAINHAKNNNDSNNNNNEEEDAELVVKINDFVSFTGATNVNAARRYLVPSSSSSSSIGGGEMSIEDNCFRKKEKGEKNDEEEEEEEEPDFYALTPMPPLEEYDGDEEELVLVSPLTPAEIVVTKALHKYQSHRTIRRTLLRYIVNRRIQQQQQQGVQQVMPSSSSSSSSILTMANQHGTEHYLFQSLIHPSLLVRRAAARIILHNYHHTQQRSCSNITSTTTTTAATTNTSMKNDGLVLRDALLVLLNSLMFGTTMVLPRYKDQYDGGDPTLQIMGLLTSLICDGGFTNLLVFDEIHQQHRLSLQQRSVMINSSSSSSRRSKNNVKDDYDTNHIIFAKEYMIELSTLYGIESFVAGGGLRWACGSIVQLVHMLVYGLPLSSSSSSASSQPLPNEDGGSDESSPSSSKHYLQERGRGIMSPLDEITSRTVQTRLRLMVDLVYRLVLFGSVPAAVDRHKLLSSTATMRRSDDGNVDAYDGSCGGAGTGTREGTSLVEAAADNDDSQSTRELHDFIPRNGGTTAGSTTGLSSYASALLGGSGVSSSMYNAILGHSPSSRRTFRGANVGCSSLANLGGTASSFSASDGIGGGGDPVSEESRQRRDNRQAVLERVNNLFWSSTLPAAIYDIPTVKVESECAVGATTINEKDDDTLPSSQASKSVGHLSPLACLIAAHEILRSRPQSHSTLATNNQHFRAAEKGIAILGRIIDPNVSNPLVVVDSELPWVLGSHYLFGGESGNSAKSGKKRGRAYSNESHRSRSSSTSSQHAMITRTMPPPHRRVAGGDERQQNKRARTSATTLSSVSSLLERLTRMDAGAAGSSSSSTAASLSEAGLSSTYAARYRTAMDSMMRSTSAAGSGSATLSTAASTLRNSRDGSLSRLLASTVGGTERLGLSRPSPPAPPLPIASSAGRSSLLRSNALAIAAAEVEEWRVLHELPEGGDVMDVDENDFSNDDDNDDDDDEEFVGNNSNVNDEGDSGEVEEIRCHLEEDDDEDSAADSACEELSNQPDNDNEFNEPEASNNNEVDDDSASDDEAVVAGIRVDNAYEEETDDDDEAYDNSQFDDAVINLGDINLASSDHGTRNPHRQSTSRGNAAGFRSFGDASGAGNAGSSSVSGTIGGISPIELASKKRDREQNFLCAAMSILAAQFSAEKSGCAESTAENCSSQRLSFSAIPCATIITPLLLTSNAEQSLLRSLCNIVKPPRKPLNLKIFMRRAPTQEEFFRGNLNKNPIALSKLRAADAGPSSSGGGGGGSSNNVGVNGGSDEPLVSDLRLHIAKDLQMEDSAEMLELLVANKILDMNLKLRVVQQVLWKKYVEENATSASSLGVAFAGPSHQMISTGSGLSMIFSSSGLVAARSRANAGGDDNIILESFPPMVVTYRLAGVDGEATEDTVEVNELEDPEAPSTANQTPAAIEQRMEKEFGITRMMVQQHNGVAVILASVQGTISDLLRRIRRDEVARRRLLRSTHESGSNEDGNITREQFAKSPPCPGLVLLRLCANISDNRKKMLANRAPTLLLRMLLDILNAMNRSSGIRDARQRGRNRASTFDFLAPLPMDTSPVLLSRKRAHHVEGNPTTNALQEIIELLASDISAEISDESKVSGGGSSVNLSELESGISQQTIAVKHQDEDRTLPLVMKSLHSTDLSPPLRKVIAKLLPFLTYGQVSQSKELASYFNRHFNVDRLGMMTGTDAAADETEQQLQFDVLMNIFVEAAINLPPVSVCDNLRKELISNGFIEHVRCFLLKDAPSQPPSWSPALYSKSSTKLSENVMAELKEEWRSYFDRPGLSQAFKILTGLCSRHHATQILLSDIFSDGSDHDKNSCAMNGDDIVLSLLTLCHWIESTSNNTTSKIKNPNGILAETFLDALKEDNELCAKKIDFIRKKTRDRKRELAEERRNKALVGMSVFGKLAGAAVSGPMTASNQDNSSAGSAEDASSSAENRSIFASMFASYLPHGSASQPIATRASSAKESTAAASQLPPQPSWMAEMEAMADEAGVTCAICQEGRTFQPAELLGLYAYTKKITVPSSQGGGKGDVDGTVLLLSLPLSLPIALIHSTDMQALFTKARSAANALEGTSHALSVISLSTSITGGTSISRANYYTTTVSAGNAIHMSCHKKAKTADRNHPKAPKSEWEGASLRNSRITCNVILPLISSETATIPLLVAIESALTDYNASIMNTLGARPKSSLWNCLHDVRFLLLRMAHGEALGADCGGGSSSSNFLLLLYQLYSADRLAKNAEHDESLEVSRHARGLSSGFLVGVDVVDNPDFDHADSRLQRLERGVAASAPMAALLSILFYNTDDNKSIVSGSTTKTHDISGSANSDEKKGPLLPSPMRQWEVYKTKFLAGLIRCAGHRHSMGVTDSGCVTSRGISTGCKNIERVRSYKDWALTSSSSSSSNDVSESSLGVFPSKSSRRNTMIEDYSRALRPMITLYAVFDQLSKEFVIGNSDEITSEASEHLATKLDLCYKSNDIHELLRVAEITVGHDIICKCFEKGATSC